MRITLVCECVVRDWYETTCVFQPKKIVNTMYAYEFTFLIHGVCCGAPKSHGSTITCAFIPKISTLTPPFIHKSKVSHAPWHCFKYGVVYISSQCFRTRGIIFSVKTRVRGNTTRGSLLKMRVRNQGLATMDKGRLVSLFTNTDKSVSNES